MWYIITITLLAILLCLALFKLWHLSMEHVELQLEHSKALLKIRGMAEHMHKTPYIEAVHKQPTEEYKPAPEFRAGHAPVKYSFRPLWDDEIPQLLRKGLEQVNVDCPKCGVVSIVCTHFPTLHGQGECTGCRSTIIANNGVLSVA